MVNALTGDPSILPLVISHSNFIKNALSKGFKTKEGVSRFHSAPPSPTPPNHTSVLNLPKISQIVKKSLSALMGDPPAVKLWPTILFSLNDPKHAILCLEKGFT